MSTPEEDKFFELTGLIAGKVYNVDDIPQIQARAGKKPMPSLEQVNEADRGGEGKVAAREENATPGKV